MMLARGNLDEANELTLTSARLKVHKILHTENCKVKI